VKTYASKDEIDTGVRTAGDFEAPNNETKSLTPQSTKELPTP